MLHSCLEHSFGDQHRAYLRGQLTVQKISRKVDAIWRHCHHLSDYAYRIDVSQGPVPYVNTVFRELAKINPTFTPFCTKSSVIFFYGLTVFFVPLINMYKQLPAIQEMTTSRRAKCVKAVSSLEKNKVGE